MRTYKEIIKDYDLTEHKESVLLKEINGALDVKLLQYRVKLLELKNSLNKSTNYIEKLFVNNGKSLFSDETYITTLLKEKNELIKIEQEIEEVEVTIDFLKKLKNANDNI